MGVRVFALLAVGSTLALWLGPERSPSVMAVIGMSAALATLGGVLRGRVGWTAAAVATVGAGFALAGARTFQYPADSVANLLVHGRSHEPTLLTVEGVILEKPETRRPARGELARFVRDDPATRFTLRVFRAGEGEHARTASGDLWVRVEGVAMGLRAGQVVRVRGQAFAVEPPMNPGERDFRARSRERNLAGRLLVPDRALAKPAEARTARERALALRVRTQEALRARASAWLDAVNASDEARALLGAALLGETEGAYTRVQRSFARTGLAHVLAISGLHLGLLAMFALVAARAVVPGRRTEALVVAIAVALYLAIVPANPPVVRAGIMTLGFLLAEALGRRYDPLNVLGWTACAIVAARPTDLTSVGFQLSFAAVGGLVAFSKPVRDALRTLLRVPEVDPDQRTRRQRVAAWVTAALGTSIAAWAITAPLVALRVGVLTPWAAFAAVLVAPAFSGLLGLGYVTMLAGAVSPSLGVLLAQPMGHLAEGLLWLVRVLERAPLGAVNTPPMAWWWCALATVAVAQILRRGLRARGALLALAAVVGVVALQGGRAGRLEEGAAFRIDTLAVGDGACHLLRSEDDALLWDCGSTWVGIGARDIPDALRALGAWRVRTLVVSHPNLDHYSGVLDVARRIGLREVVAPRGFFDEADADPLGPVAYTLARLRAMGVAVRTAHAGDALTLGGARVEFLWPAEGFATEQANDGSLVAQVRVPTEQGERVALLLGDIEPAGIDAMVRTTGALRADVVEAPHHGSARDRSIAFVASLGAGAVVQSTGPQRLGDERWDGVKATATWWTTAQDGAAFVEIRRDGSIVSGPTLAAQRARRADQPGADPPGADPPGAGR
jgi:competence protein ComEC